VTCISTLYISNNNNNNNQAVHTDGEVTADRSDIIKAKKRIHAH